MKRFIFILTIVCFAFSIKLYSQNTPTSADYLLNISEGVSAPYRLAIKSDGSIYVSDVSLRKIIKFDASFNYIKTLTIGIKPTAVAINSSDEVFVGDATTGTIYKLDGSDNPTIFSTYPNHPTAMVFDNNDLLYIVDRDLKQVTVLNTNGDYNKTIGAGDLVYPTGITYNPIHNSILVAEHGGIGEDIGWFNGYPLTQIWNYDLAGNNIGTIGEGGNDDGEFYRIQGMVVSKNGVIYVVDPFQASINAFENDGTYLDKFGIYGKQKGQLNIPIDVKFDANNRLLITSMNTGAIEVYNINEVNPTYNISATNELICGNSSTNIKIDFAGKAPWTFTYTKDGANPVTITDNYTNPYTINVTEPGVYGLSHLSDGNFDALDYSKTVTIKQNALPTSNISSGDVEICSGDSTPVEINFTGTSPFSFRLNDGTSNLNLISETSVYTFNAFEDATYTVNYIRGGEGCVGTEMIGSAIITKNNLPSSIITSNDTSICEGENTNISIEFTGTAPWTFTYAINSVSQTPITTSDNPYLLNATEAGSYEIVALNDNSNTGICFTGSTTINILPKPTASFVSVDKEMCEGETSILNLEFTGQTNWNFTYTVNGQNPKVISDVNVSYYELEVQDSGLYEITEITSNTCSGTILNANTSVTVYPLPVSNITYDSELYTIYNGDTLDFNVELTGTSPWEFTFLTAGIDPVIYNTNDPNKVLHLTRSETYEISSITDAFCTNINSGGALDIFFDSSPTAKIENSTTVICDGEIATIPIELTGTGPWTFTYTRNGTDSMEVKSNKNEFLLMVKEAGIYEISAISDSKTNGSYYTGSAEVIINEVPSSTFTISEINICSGDTALVPIEFNGTGPFTFTYTINGINPTEIVTTENQYTINSIQGGSYSITSLTNGLCNSDGVINNSTTNVIFNELPIVSLGADTNLCESQTLVLDAGTHNSYLWSDGSSNQSITVSAEGNYSVSVTNENNCSASDNINISTTPLPSLNLGEDQTVCDGESINIGTSGFDSYLWSTGSTDSVISIDNEGSFSLTITDSFGCQTSDELILSVNELPLVSLGADTSICEGQSIILNAGTHSFYLWSDGSSNQNLTVSAEGNYRVSVTNENGCITSDNINISTTPLPILNLGEDKAICNGETINIGTSGFESYLWTTGSTDSIITVINTGSYTLTITDGFGCQTSDEFILIVNDLPIVSLGTDTSLCEGQSIILNAGIHSSYLWSNGSSNQNLTVSAEGNYSVSVTNENGCTASDNINISTNPIPSLNLGTDQEVCYGESINIGTSGFDSYLWSTGSTDSVISINDEGTYSLTITDGFGCQTSDELILSVNDLPLISLGNDTSFCEGQSLVLNAGSHNSYLWSDGSTKQSLQVNSSGIYSIFVSNTNGCTNSDTIEITVKEIPVVSIGSDTIVCEGDNLILDAGEFASYLWSNGSNTRTLEVNTEGTYTVTITNIEGCSNSDEININTSPKPFADFTYISNNLEVSFINSSQYADYYAWEFGDLNTSNEVDPVHIYENPGNYEVKLVASNNYCGDSTIRKTLSLNGSSVKNLKHTVLIYPNPSNGIINIEIPNSGVSEMNVTIINSAGQTVYINKIDAQTKAFTIDLSNLAQGVYTIRTGTKLYTETQKLILSE